MRSTRPPAMPNSANSLMAASIRRTRVASASRGMTERYIPNWLVDNLWSRGRGPSPAEPGAFGRRPGCRGEQVDTGGEREERGDDDGAVGEEAQELAAGYGGLGGGGVG